jgi:hypothetical protein
VTGGSLQHKLHKNKHKAQVSKPAQVLTKGVGMAENPSGFVTQTEIWFIPHTGASTIALTASHTTARRAQPVIYHVWDRANAVAADS